MCAYQMFLLKTSISKSHVTHVFYNSNRFIRRKENIGKMTNSKMDLIKSAFDQEYHVQHKPRPPQPTPPSTHTP